ncbi:hypothetical protein [Gynuella sunshinyii]|uniref:Peptidase C-terminal archaeal/bacterial domain-containing protein n=1 Tax=Gynuella sunshinyii YC6258 TaxID=1445510 RepID=A0A0C5VEC6_9GAMM|nr:hypothetical protein [Gynuella sunshinyii]AJQ92566.1 hypothetical Protein YC6258_00516 [Gynuella sunshinyii YC6258]
MLTIVRSLLVVVVLFGLQGCYIEIADDHEGDSIHSATYLDMSHGNVRYSGSFEDEWDKDVFRLVVVNQGYYHFWSSSKLNITGQLLSSNGEVIASDSGHYDNGYNFSFISYLRAGTYYLSINGEHGNYVINIDSDEDTFWDDIGNSIDDATLLPFSHAIAAEIDYPTDVDVFEIRIDKSGYYHFYTDGDLDTYGYLMASDGDIINYADDNGRDKNFSIVEYLYAGTYYLSVESFNSSDTGIYVVYADYD